MTMPCEEENFLPSMVRNSLETTSLLKELGAKCVVSRAERDVQAKFLLRNGADQVVYPEKQVAKWAAIRYTADHIFRLHRDRRAARHF